MKAKYKEVEERMSASEESDEYQDNVGDQFGECKDNKQKNRSDQLIGSLLLYWVKVMNYLFNCLDITPRCTTGNNSGLRNITRIH